MDTTVTVTMSAYIELISREERLTLLENALAKCESYELDNIRKIFGIEKEVKK